MSKIQVYKRYMNKIKVTYLNIKYKCPPPQPRPPLPSLPLLPLRPPYLASLSLIVSFTFLLCLFDLHIIKCNNTKATYHSAEAISSAVSTLVKHYVITNLYSN